jgi:SAM-dependent methyltransferase
MHGEDGLSANYDYVLQRACDHAAPARPRILDYGCGRGQSITLGLARGLDIWGTDTFAGPWEHWQKQMPATTAARILTLEDGRVPVPDGHFDAVIANQVFEHLHDVPAALREIRRVLKPGAPLLALFPTHDTWWEGHTGLYFVHYLSRLPALRRLYLDLAHRCGFGFYRSRLDRPGWVAQRAKVIDQYCVYHDMREVRGWWRESFGAPPRSLAADYIRFRLAHHPRLAAARRLADGRAAAPLLALVCHRRAGRVLLARKPA